MEAGTAIPTAPASADASTLQYAETVAIDWPLPLNKRIGLKGYTGGIEIYFDFDWAEVIGHRHSKFKHCKPLSKRARADSRDGRCPAILLTVRSEITAARHVSDTHRVVIANIHKLRQAKTVPQFYEDASHVPLTDLPAIEDELIAIAALVENNPDLAPRIEQIAAHVTPRPPGNVPSIKTALDIIESARQISEADATELVALIKYRVQSGDVLEGLLDAVLDATAVLRWTKRNKLRRTELIGELRNDAALMESVSDVVDFIRTRADLSSDEISAILEVLPKGNRAVFNYLRQNMKIVKRLAENEYTESDLQAVCYRRLQLGIFDRLLHEHEYFQSKLVEWHARGPESVWQSFFERNQWIFGYGLRYVFMTAVEQHRLEQTTSGGTFDHGGKRIDALMKTTGELSHLCFVELKKHDTELLKAVRTPYRAGCWAISDDLAGGITQVQQTIDKAVRQRGESVSMVNAVGDPKGEELFLHQPKGLLVIGCQDQFKTPNGTNVQKLGSFELFRRNTVSPEIVTFDELYDRAKYIIEHSSVERPPEELPEYRNGANGETDSRSIGARGN